VEKSEPPGQTTVLSTLAQFAKGLSAEDVARRANLTPEAAQCALATLQRHDVVIQIDNNWQFTIELMRRCVAQHKKLE
jgi:DNA-binding IclR family transcriptional regulator